MLNLVQKLLMQAFLYTSQPCSAHGQCGVARPSRTLARSPGVATACMGHGCGGMDVHNEAWAQCSTPIQRHGQCYARWSKPRGCEAEGAVRGGQRPSLHAMCTARLDRSAKPIDDEFMASGNSFYLRAV